MGWAARTHHKRGDTKPLMSTVARRFTNLKPGQTVSMSRERSYVVAADGSLRRLRFREEKAA